MGMPTRTAPAGHAGDGHQPAHALRDLVDAGALGVRPVLAEAGDRGVDDARVHRAHVVVVDAEPVLHRRAHVLDDDVGLRPAAMKTACPRAPSGRADRACCGAGSGSRSRRARRRGPRSAPGGSMRTTSAPQSARWRTQVGPARARVRSSTRRPTSGSGSTGGSFGVARFSDTGILLSPRKMGAAAWPRMRVGGLAGPNAPSPRHDSRNAVGDAARRRGRSTAGRLGPRRDGGPYWAGRRDRPRRRGSGDGRRDGRSGGRADWRGHRRTREWSPALPRLWAVRTCCTRRRRQAW